MSSKLFLGQASNYTTVHLFKHLFAFGSRKCSNNLRQYLATKFDTKKERVYLMNNGRSAITAALKTLFPTGAEVMINGFTCYAVVQALEKANCTPVYVDIDEKTLNFNVGTLEKALKLHPKVKCLIIQNTLGIIVNVTEIEDFAKKHQLKIIEDLAHSAGSKYQDGRAVGSVGAAAALSFGKGKVLDAITGGALVLNDPDLPAFKFHNHRPKLADTIRARWYPVFGAIGRLFSEIHLEKYWYGPLIKMGWIERAVDAKIDLSRRPAHWQAKMILEQLQKIDLDGATPIRTHRLVKDRDKLITELDQQGYNFREIWYDVPVSPVRYYKQLHFPEDECPVATSVASRIINLPTYYPASELRDALKLIEEYE